MFSSPKVQSRSRRGFDDSGSTVRLSVGTRYEAGNRSCTHDPDKAYYRLGRPAATYAARCQRVRRFPPT